MDISNPKSTMKTISILYSQSLECVRHEDVVGVIDVRYDI